MCRNICSVSRYVRVESTGSVDSSTVVETVRGDSTRRSTGPATYGAALTRLCYEYSLHWYQVLKVRYCTTPHSQAACARCGL